MDALRRLVEFTFDHHHQHEEFIRMVMIENIHNGQYLDRSEAIRELNVTAIDHIAEIYERGVADVVFRPGIDPVELHWQVSRSEEHTSELQSLMRISYAVFCLKKKTY